MTVRELIEALQQLDPDLPVTYDSGVMSIDRVEVETGRTLDDDYVVLS